MDKDKMNEIETEIDGIEFVVKDTILNLQVLQRRLGELRETILQNKKSEIDEF